MFRRHLTGVDTRHEGVNPILGRSDPEYRSDSIVDSHRQFDLDQDVVATEAEVGSSTYLISRPWLDRRLRDGAARVKRYVVISR